MHWNSPAGRSIKDFLAKTVCAGTDDSVEELLRHDSLVRRIRDRRLQEQGLPLPSHPEEPQPDEGVGG